MIFSLFKNYMAQRRRRMLRERTPEQQLVDYFAELPSSPTGLAGELAAAMLAKKSLDTTKQVSAPFPEAYFTGERAVDDEGLATLHIYEQKLQNFREHLVHHNSIFTISVARGVSVWIATIHTLRNPALQPKGVDLWNRLVQGEPYLEEAYKMMTRREITDVEREYMKFRPTVFVSNTASGPWGRPE